MAVNVFFIHPLEKKCENDSNDIVSQCRYRYSAILLHLERFLKLQTSLML